MAKHVYVHIPFCKRKCPYCDFYSVTDDNYAQYFEALNREIDLFSSIYRENNHDNIDTVYFGGGTPSVPDHEFVCDSLRRILKEFDIGSDAEITIEINPNSLTFEKAKAYKEAGFNRVSLGVQSLDDEVLKTLGRLHNSKEALEAIDILTEAGFENISSDLIIAVPGQTLDMLKSHADVLISKGVKHISTYSLTIEKGTPFYKLYKKKIEDLVPPETEREMYHGIRNHLASKGVIPYEISNSAIEGYESRHNYSYWEGLEYIGLGAGSHGYFYGIRYGHVDNVSEYIKGVSGCNMFDLAKTFDHFVDLDFLYVEEAMDYEAKMREYPFLKLRTSAGIDLEWFKIKYRHSFEEEFEDALKSNISKGFLEICDGHVRLTTKGLDWANQVFSDFL